MGRLVGFFFIWSILFVGSFFSLASCSDQDETVASGSLQAEPVSIDELSSTTIEFGDPEPEAPEPDAAETSDEPATTESEAGSIPDGYSVRTSVTGDVSIALPDSYVELDLTDEEILASINATAAEAIGLDPGPYEANFGLFAVSGDGSNFNLISSPASGVSAKLMVAVIEAQYKSLGIETTSIEPLDCQQGECLLTHVAEPMGELLQIVVLDDDQDLTLSWFFPGEIDDEDRASVTESFATLEIG